MRCTKYEVWYKIFSVKEQTSRRLRLLQFKHHSFKIFLSFVSLLFITSSYAQVVSASLDRDKILLGEQVILELKAENINLQAAPVRAWFSLPDTANHIEVVKRSPIDTIAINGTTSYLQTITLTSFDSGDWKLPKLSVVLQGNNGQKDTVVANELTLEVLPVDISNLQQYHPMKDIIDVEVSYNYWLIAIISFIILAGIAIAIYFFYKNRKKKPVELKPVAARSLFETAIGQLEKLQKDDPPAPVFYTKLDEICRTFIQTQLHIRASQLTTDELMVQLNVYMQSEARSPFYQLLRLISAVKFAKYYPEDSGKAADVNTAKEAIRHIYYHLQRNLAQHAS